MLMNITGILRGEIEEVHTKVVEGEQKLCGLEKHQDIADSRLLV